MVEKAPKSNNPKDSPTAAEQRQHRSAEALRANLRRRKAQARDRVEEGGDTSESPPPAKDR